jgi:hypothetical protein
MGASTTRDQGFGRREVVNLKLTVRRTASALTVLIGVQACGSSPNGEAPSTKTTLSTGMDASVTPDASTAMDASTTQNVSNEGGLDVVTASNAGDGGSISIGPAGGHLVFANGVILDVPAGALSQTVTVSVTLLTALPGFTGDPAFIAAVQLEPEGITFASPATLTIPLPAGTSTAPLGAYAMDDVTAFSNGDAGEPPTEAADAGADDADDAGTQDDSVADDIAFPLTDVIVGTTTTSAQILVDHFSVHFILQQQTGLLSSLSKGTSTGTGPNCTNASLNTSGLSAQLMQLLPSTASLVPITPVVTGPPPPPWLYVAASSVSDLQSAMADCNKDTACGSANRKIQVNWGWRSLATQYVVQGACTPNPTGYPMGCSMFPLPGSYTAATGTSNHGQGLAVDVKTWQFPGSSVRQLRALCNAYEAQTPGASIAQLMDYLFSPGIGEALFKHNWVWWGYFANNTCSDPVHFEYRSIERYTATDGGVTPPINGAPNGNQAFPLLKAVLHGSERKGLFVRREPC